VNPGAERTLPDWLRLLRDGWFALVLLVVLGLLAGLAATAAQATRYSATSSLVTTPARGFLQPTGANTLPGLAQTVARLLETHTVLRRVARRYAALAPDQEARRARLAQATDDWLSARLSAEQVASTSIVQVEATGSTQRQAQELARSGATALSAAVTAVGPRSQGISLPVFTAGTPEGRVSPTPVRNLLIGADAGLLLGIVAALALGAARGRLRRPEHVAAALGTPLLGAVRLRRRGIKAEDAGVAEARARLLALLAQSGGKAFLVSGDVRPRRLAEVSEALARSFNAAGVLALMVDAELENASLSRRLGLADAAGLAEAIDGASPAELVVSMNSQTPELAVLPAGHASVDAATSLSRTGLSSSIGALSATYEVVLVCGPAFDRPAEVLSLLEAVDHAVVVTMSGSSQRRLDRVRSVGDSLRRRLVGVVVLD
jgi:Mrp family chromosome partitioning ATPase